MGEYIGTLILPCITVSATTKLALTEEDKQWISVQLERLETKLLTAFHTWASPVELRQRGHSAAIRAIDVEMETLQDRVKNLEQPPSA